MERANLNTGISPPATIGYIIHFILTDSNFLQIFPFLSSIHMSSSSNRHGITVARFLFSCRSPRWHTCLSHTSTACLHRVLRRLYTLQSRNRS